MLDDSLLFDESVQVACNFKTPQLLSEGLREYIGDAELKKSCSQLKKKEEIPRIFLAMLMMSYLFDGQVKKCLNLRLQ